jgi:membrane protein DedA with SNARE-associated domain
VGLIIVGFTVWGTFFFLWVEVITQNYRFMRQYGWLIAVVGIIIFLYIGLRMMNEDKKNKDLEDQRRE